MSAFAAASGLGSWPGTSPRPAAEVVVGELHGLTHLVELPARGIGADMIGRGAALVVDIALDTTPRGYRVATRPGAVTRRAKSLLGEDIDALEEAWERAGLRGSERAVKVQAPGPVTLAAQVELAGGHRAITDTGALRDLAASLAEGVSAHRSEVAKRLGCPVLVQFDEPSLPAALAGQLTGVTRLTPVAPVDESVVLELFDGCVSTVGGEVVLHCCATGVPWDMLRRSAFHAVSVDATRLGNAGIDGLGHFVDGGRSALLGMVPAIAPQRRVSAGEVADAVVALADQIGVGRSALGERLGVTPVCGLAGASDQWARTAIELAQKAADAIVGDPEALSSRRGSE